MSRTTFRGEPLKTCGVLPAVGTIAPPFSLTRRDLSEIALQGLPEKPKLLNIFPSLDTSVCSLTVKAFAKQLGERDDVLVINISKDLPFAQGRFCMAEHLEKAEFLSAFRSSFAKDYGIEIVDGPLKGLCSRCVLLLDSDNRILYAEQVTELTHEPDYARALDALNRLSNTHESKGRGR